MAGISSKAAGGIQNKRKYNGKELQSQEFSDGSGIEWYDFGARQQDPQTGRWCSVDPLAYKRDWLTPYNFVQNNPLIRIDPNGETDFKLNEKTGEINQVGDKNDEPDRLLKTNKKGNVKTKGNSFLVKKSERGKPKVAISGIAKGILKDGINFQTHNQVIDVGGTNQPNVKDVEGFLLKFSDYIGKEISGYGLSPKGQNNVSHLYIGLYQNNTETISNTQLTQISTRPNLLSTLTPQTYFHTHLSKFSDTERITPSSGDLDRKKEDLENGIKIFEIITTPKNVSY